MESISVVSEPIKFRERPKGATHLGKYRGNRIAGVFPSAGASSASARMEQTLIPGPISLMGPPGAGKGTQAKLLMALWSIPQVSAGDLLRDMRRDPEKAASPLGREIRASMDAGRLIPDELVQAVVLDRLRQPDTRRGYVLDGFPRTLRQAMWLDQELNREKDKLPVITIGIRVHHTKLSGRIRGRRHCPNCLRIYNTHSCLPERDMVCDVDGTALVLRPDDSAEVLGERMRTYEEMTLPVIDHYRGTARFVEVNGELPVDDITRAITDAIADFRN